MMTSAIGTAAITYGASMISAVVRPMADKAMEIVKDTAKDINVVDYAMEIVKDKEIDFTVVDQVDGIVNIERDISNLQTTLLMVEGIVPLAEEKQIDNDFIRNWLSDLVDISYEARDVLDDFITFYSCIIVESSSKSVNFISSRISFMSSYFGGLSSEASELPLAVLNQLANDIKCVKERFDVKIKQSENFATPKSVVGGGSESVRMYRRIEVEPFINQQRDNLFVGREEEKEEIMKKLLRPSDNRVHVVPIWGMGGIGKTTLALSIYNDERLKEEDYPSKNRLWHCVGEDKFSAEKVIREIVSDSNTSGIGSLQKKLVEKLKGGRFLIVLDDVWEVDVSEWNLLFNPLTYVGKGGFIIITTRRREVFTATNTPVPDTLRPLSNQHSWLIFESHAFIDGNSDSRPDLKRIGQQIVEKLNGLPLALEVVGRSLLNEKDTHTWTNFLESKEWMLRNNEDDVMPTLRWSYNHLPSHLKQCFAYCALFPKDHVYDKKELVEMWMAHDLIHDIMGGGGWQTRLEDVGAEYFNELVYASLLQLVDDEYVMHDMIHDLALLVSNEEFSCGNGSTDQMQKVRHITINLDDDCSTNLSLCKSKRILTLYTISSQQNFEENTSNFDNSILENVFKQLKSIRVLVLSHEEITEIPDCISELRHLRYFDISQTKVKSLPDSLCDLCHLQTLAAPLDTILPRNIVNMANLRHLRANITTYEGIAKLTSLQELSSISVCEDGNISELGKLVELRGKLKIRGLENVTRSEDAAEALMRYKTHIDQLELVFDVNLGDAAIATKVLDALQCPPKLTSLTISEYRGNKFPNWMTSGNHVVNLQRLGLYKCHQLLFLSPLGELKSLKHLDLKSMHGVEQLGDELYGRGKNGKVLFPSLVSISLSDMKNLKEWDSTDVFFPILESLKFCECPKLVSILPPSHSAQQVVSKIKEISISDCKKLRHIGCERLPSLTDLSVNGCDEIKFISHLVSIERLNLHECRKLRSVTIDPQGLVKSLTDLDIEGCPLLESIYEEGSTSSSSSSSSSALPLSNLQDIITDNKRIFEKLFNRDLVSIASISIDGFNGVERFGDIVQNKWKNLDVLVNLFIDRCKDLTSLSPKFHDLPSLKVLHICSCPKLESLPAGGLPDSLERLKIEGCPLLFERCKECGPDWDKIKHISDREILLPDPDYNNVDEVMLMITYEASMISAIVRPTADKAMEIVDQVDGNVNIETEICNLQKTLRTIEGIVQVAEEKQIDSVFIRNWLRELNDVGYEARDVLDDFITFSSCITAEGASESVSIDPSSSNSSSDPLEPQLKVPNQLAKDIKRARERFDEKIRQSETFAIVGDSASVRKYCRREVGPFINQQRDYMFLGREDVKEGIMEKILRPSDNLVHVVPIWGTGGIGKTALALSIYNDQRLNEEDYPCKNRRWLCVGNKKRFDAEEIITKIINDSSTDDWEKLQTKLEEKLRGNRFIIVLDDVWHINGGLWHILFSPLTNVGKGGFIIITTRRSEVFAEINTQTPDELKPLSEDDSWSIFANRVFIDGNADSRPDLKCIGEKIVKKLNGLPLALEVVGSSLSNELDASAWTDFLESKEWMLGKEDNEIMPALKWSYNRLPPHLKMCFSYCSLFPKDHVFVENVLVVMWIAHGLVQKQRQNRPEDVGAQYFKELVNASLLQCVDGKYMMHDMIHDLALLVSNEEFATPSSNMDQMEKVRHITITPNDYSKIPHLCNIEKLLTLYTIRSDEEDENCFDDSVLDGVLKQLKSIRVLVLYGRNITVIPDWISELRHLRYFDVSQTSVRNLPDSLCRLYNLQMLAAPPDAELSREIVNMFNLRYVRANLSTCMGVGKLTSLQELSSIRVCEGGNIRELGDMQRLRGKLTIEGLENVTSSEDAAGALMEKQTLMHQLELVFNRGIGEYSTISEEVLDAIGCPPNLTCLKIVGYNGLQPPSWIVDGRLVAKLETLELSNCHQLESLPPLGELKCLKHLSLKSLHGVQRLGDEFYGNLTNKNVFFPALESLYFCEMKEWKEWDDISIRKSSVSYFPSLTSLEIDQCPKLVLVLPTVKNGTLNWKPEDKRIANFMKSLSRLKICDCPGLKRLQLDVLASLKELDINLCSNLVQITSATTIRSLQILQCEHLQTMDFKRSTSLKYLDIRSCHNLTSIPCLAGITYLDKCESLGALSINIRDLDSLERLTILSCPVLELEFEEGSGSSSSSRNSVAVQLRIRTDNTKFFRKLLHHELISLESLHIEKLTGFENFGEMEANNFCKLRSLKFLHISECDDLKSLPPDFHKLSSLESLHIESCKHLQSLPPDFHKLSSLKSLHIESCTQLQSLPPDFHKLSSLEYLHIESCRKLQSFPPDFHKLSSLRSLYIESCPKLQLLPPEFHKLSSLESLHIESCKHLQSLPPDFHKLSSLETLHIESCTQLQSLPPDFHKLSSLEYLHIESCTQLQSLPDLGLPHSLEALLISDCPQLHKRCKRESGDDWCKIQHIPEIIFDDEEDDDDDEDDDGDDTEYLVSPVVQAEEEEEEEEEEDEEEKQEKEEEHTSDIKSGQEKGEGTPIASMISAIVRPMADKAMQIFKDKTKDFMVVDGNVNFETEISNLQTALDRIEEKQIDKNVLRDLIDIGYEARDELDEFITLSSCITAEGDPKSVKFISSRISFMQSYFNIGGSSSDPLELQRKVQERYAKKIQLVRERFKKKERNTITRPNTPVGGGSESALVKKYKCLPPHLKMCFTYCFLFPKDHVLDKKVLVEMWMAHDLIQREEKKRPEDAGAEYFNQLVEASLLQCVDGKYMMHVDVIHDPALLVSKEEFVSTNGSLSSDQMENVRHITITSDYYSKIPLLHKSKKLLTLYTICSGKENPERFDGYGEEDTNWFDDYDLYDVFKQLKSIRVLVLSSECIHEIPDCISGLIHLRYLDINRTRVRNLPDSSCHLYNLQMLAAPLDAKLPRDIVNMVNLRYIRANLPTCQGVGKLTSLQELSSISVCEDDNIRELGDMQLLRGKLTIKGLENVTSSEDAAGASMEKQILMDQLELVFDKENSGDTPISEEVLNALGCPPNLTCLQIVGYNGLELPRWIQDGKHKFDKLQTLEVSECRKLESLPPLGELTSLKYLSLKSLHGVQRLGDEFYGKFTRSKVFFPALESLRFYDMQEWEEWDDITIENFSVSFFPRLTSLEIEDCAKLGLVRPTVMNAANFMTSLSCLKICDCHGLKRLELDDFVSLKELDINLCSSLVQITSAKPLATPIERLQIFQCEHLETMNFERLLKHLDVRGCRNLISIPRLAGIRFLYLHHCQSLTTLSIEARGLNSLEDLSISDCPVLELAFEEGSSSSSSSGNSVAVRLHISTDKKQIFTKLFQHEFVSLESLDIESVTEIENFSNTEEKNFCQLKSLKSLCISRCKELKSLPAHFHNLSSLNSLKIENCPKLQSLSPDFHKLFSLKRLEIISCPRLQSLSPDFHELSSIESLHINDCQQLQSLPARGLPPSMKSLDILNCPLLYERCKDESSCDWHKIRHIPKITIFGEHKVHRYGGGW